MPYVITASDVKEGYTTSASDTEVDALIAFMDQADACLTANAVIDGLGKHLKILGVRHMLALTESNGSGKAVSEKSASGASRTFSDRMGKGPEATSFGTLLTQLDRTRCVIGLFSNDQPVLLKSIGPSAL